MELDRVLAGYILTTLMISTAFCVIVLRERSTEPLAVLATRVPDRVFSRAMGTTDRFSFSLVVRRDITDLEMRFSVLREEKMVKELAGGSCADRLRSVEEVKRLQSLFDEVGGLPDEVNSPILFNESDCRLVALDYTPLYARVANGMDLRHTPTIFGGVFWPNGTLAAFFRGFAGVLPAMDQTLVDLRVTAGDVGYYYRRNETGLGVEEVLPLSKAPQLGIFHCSQLKKDDRVVVEYEAEGSAFKFAKTARAYFSKRNVLLVQIWVNGKSWKSLAWELDSGVY